MKTIRILAALCVALLLGNSAAFAAKAHIAEFRNLGVTALGVQPPIAPMPPVVEQSLVDFTSGVASSSAFGSTTTYIRVNCDTRCAVKIGASPQTATTSNTPLGANAPEYFAVSPGHVLSVIANP